MKNKQIAFKNPFDLIEEEEEDKPLSLPSQRVVYQPTQQTVYNPLPFNPYQLDQPAAQTRIQAKPQPPQVVYQPKTYAPPQTTFVAPFQTDEKTHQTTQTSRTYETYSEERAPREYELDENGDPPLLDDIGIEPQKIKERVLLILKMGKPSYEMVQDSDLSGPILIAMTLGCLLLFAGKIHFGDIYAMFILGNLLLYFLLNFMGQADILPLYSIMSILGYGLLPMLALGVVGVFFTLNGGMGILVALGTAVWASFAAGSFLDVLLKDTRDRKVLLVYPLFLFYVSFTMIVIF